MREEEDDESGTTRRVVWQRGFQCPRRAAALALTLPHRWLPYLWCRARFTKRSIELLRRDSWR